MRADRYEPRKGERARKTFRPSTVLFRAALGMALLVPMACKNGRPFARQHSVGYGPRSGQVIVETPVLLPTGVVRADLAAPGYMVAPTSSFPAQAVGTVVASPQFAGSPMPSVAIPTPAISTGSTFAPATNYSASAYQPTPASNAAAAVSADGATPQQRGYATPGRYPRREATSSQETALEDSRANAGFYPKADGFSPPAGRNGNQSSSQGGNRLEEFAPPASVDDTSRKAEKKPAARTGFLEEFSPPRR